MQVEKDVRNAIDLVKGLEVDQRQYKSVKIFTDFSLKHFKKYKLDNKESLLKLRSYDEVLDLVSYGSNVTCFSANRFDEYFLELFLKSLNLSYKEHFTYFTKDYTNKNQMLSSEIYFKIRKHLSEDVKYFFDELYKRFNSRQLVNSGLIYPSKYPYNQLERYIRYVLNPKYYTTRDNLNERKVEFIFMSDDTAIKTFKDESFNFIDLSYNLDIASTKQQEFLLNKVGQYTKLLKENGKIQGFVSRNSEIILPGYKRIETRSIIDPDSIKNDCKKDYAYVYSNVNNIDKQ